MNKSPEKSNPHIIDEQGFQPMTQRKRNHKRASPENLPEHPAPTSNSFQVLKEASIDTEKTFNESISNHEVPIQLQVPKATENPTFQQSEKSSGKALENLSDPQEKMHSDMPMPDHNLENLEEEDMMDAIPEGLDLIGLEDACTRKVFKLIPPKQIQLLHKALIKAKLGVATSGQKGKQKAHKDAKKKGIKLALQ